MTRGAALGLAALAACASPPTVAARPKPRPPVAADPRSPRLRARGARHAPSIAIAASDRHGAAALGFVGPPEVALAAWVDAPGAGLVAVEDWPVGVRVRGGAAFGDEVLLLVESVAVLDQPGGKRGVVRLSIFDPAGTLHPWVEILAGDPLRFAGVTEVAELAAHRVDPPSAPAALHAAVDAALPSRVPRFELYQQIFLAPAGLAPLAQLVPFGVTDDDCSGMHCATGDGVVIWLGRGPGGPIVRGVARPARGGPVVHGAPPLVSAATALRATVGDDVAVVDDGVVDGAARLAIGWRGDALYAVALDGALAAVSRLALPAVPAHAPAALRVDLTGDGVAEAAVAVDRPGRDPFVVVLEVPHAVPAESTDPAGPTIALGPSLLAAGAPDLATAVARAAVPLGRTIAPARACELLHDARTAVGLAKVASDDLRLLRFTAPEQPLGATAVTAAELGDLGDRADGACASDAVGDRELDCAGVVCAAFSDARTSYYVFTWVGDEPRLARVFLYAGS